MSEVARVTPSAPIRRLFLPLAAITVASVIIAAAAVMRMATSAPGSPSTPASRFTIELPPGVRLDDTATQRLAISPDGRRIALNAGTGDDRLLYVRSLDQIDAAPVGGVEGAPGSLFFAPDGDWIGFHDTSSGAIRKIRVGGGQAATVAEASAAIEGFRDASWGSDGRIAFSTRSSRGLMQVRDAGGTPQPMTRPPAGEIHGQPHFLPDGSLLFSSTRPATSDRIMALSRETLEQRDLLDGTSPRLAASGHLVFLREGSLWAAPFDTARLQVTGNAVSVLEDVGVSGNRGAVGFGATALYDLAGNGTLVYSRSADGKIVVVLNWFDEIGRKAPAR